MYKIFIQHPVEVNSICRGNYCNSSVWILMQQVNYWSYILRSSNAWKKMGIQWTRASTLYRLQESLWFSFEARSCIIFSLSLVSLWNW